MAQVYDATFSPDGKRIVTASGDNTARIWDAATGKTMAVLSGHSDRVYSAAFSSQGDRIVTASADETARVWDAEAINTNPLSA
jgi:WD40 repeat protein